ncbi:fibrocystin isoform X18 [Balaenoptera ricei]|uniref:fibrocystin isoform X18 n=1 Tax=Balaenoptera ricei TaxID=2746895 RepID=UPI0028BF0251|nr:fibrocystin isoform X18 [Balaenoptera ricei]
MKSGPCSLQLEKALTQKRRPNTAIMPCLSVHIEPEEGSLAGGTWITVIFDGLEPGLLYPANGSQLEIHLVNVAVPMLPIIPCDISPVLLDLPIVMCRTRSLLSEAHEGLYYLEVQAGGQVVGSPSSGPRDSCTFKFSRAQTPIVYQVNPPSGVPGNLIHVYGWIITGRSETFDFDAEYVHSPLMLEAQGDKWVTPCSLVNRQTGCRYPIQEDHGLGTLQCRVEGNYIGSQNVSFSVFNKGKSMVHKDAWLVSAKQDLFLYQTYSEILSVFPETGSLGGRTDITITGDFFDNPAQVTIAGILCDIRHVSPRRIECTTRAPGKGARLSAPQAGNRGLLFEVGDAAEGLDLTEATPGYRWQIVPNASSPFGFWSKEGQPFRARLSGFFVAPETNNYTFWIQADNQASLYFSQSEDPRTKVKVASITVGTADWFDSWEQNGSEETWQQKSPKLELLGGARYYLEAEHRGRAPSSGLRIGVQIHNTWLNPEVVSTYLREKHQIQARAQRLPEIQMLMVSGTGNFFLTWDNVSSQPIPANATAHQIQAALEELLAVKCKLEPLSANILLRLGFEQGLESSSSDGHLTSGTEPFCGRFSFHQPRHLVLTPPAAQKGNRLDQYTHLCLAYKGHVNTILTVTVSFTIGFQNTVKKNVTCDWSLAGASPNSWQFTCTDLWKTCVLHSVHLQPPPVNSPVLVHQVDLLPLSPEMGVFYVDEIIIADTNLTVSQAASGTARPGGNLLELLSVVGSPPVYSVTSWLAGCGLELPLITASSVPTGGAEEGSGLVQVTTQRLQRTSPPLGGHFRIQLSNTVIPAVPVHISASHLQKLLQTNADDFTSRYLNVNDFTVTEDLKSCYEHVWTLSWSNQVGDLPSFIRVSDENLTGVNPAVTTHVVYDGGVFLGPIFGDMLVTANQYTQVVVRVNDIPAHCSGSCSFQYLEGSTPRVHSVWYALDDIDLLVYITGNSFSGDSEALQVTVNKTSCKVIFSNQTNVVCQTGLLPVGMHQISVLVRPSGLAVNASGGGLFLNVEPRLDAVEPSRAADIGGLWATIRGSSLEDVSLVLFGSQFCAINVTTSNSRRIQCKVPPKGEDGPTVNVTVIRGDHSVVLPMAFTYVSSLNPVIVSLSRNRSNIAVSLAFLCGLRPEEENCETSGCSYVQCDLTVAVGTESLPESWPYFYTCEESSRCICAQDLWTEFVFPSFSGLFISPKVERDEVLIYNSSCTITMETEAKMECETPNQPITAKITEIQKSWGQNTQGNFPFQFCRRWSRAHSWFPERLPQEGDNVTVEKGQLLLLDTNTSILNFLHVKGGKLIFLDPGPVELRAHSILVSDGGELRIGSEDKPFQGKAQIKLYGSSHSTPFFPYGVKFLAVRNGTLSLHGSLPEVVVTHLRAAAYARDTVLALEDAVDWHAGDEVIVISGMGAEGTKPLEEIVIVETAQNTDLHLRSPLRYSHNSTENWVAGELHVLKVMVVLLSRSVTIQGNLTDERVQLLASCQRASASEGDLQNCLYFKSEKMLGSRDLGARVIIQSFPKEPSWVQLKGVQFRDLGQAFCKHASSLTLVGSLRGSYMQGCTVWRSFSRGLSMARTLGLKVDSNVFYDILGHTLLVGASPEIRYIPWEVIPGRENDWSEQGNIIRNNVIISVSGAEGLSSTEMVTPSGIYIRDPTNVIEGNRVCAAGYGYFFHLVTNQTSQAPLLSFTRNSAHACTRCGLFVYPKFQPTWNNGTGPTLFQNFTVWGSAGGAQIFRSSNLHLKNFQVYACRDFGIDILESDANTSVTDSLLLAHFAPKGSLCMSAGIKTPKRWELIVSNTTFVNFDLIDCVAIRTCSGCFRGQGGFTVKTNQLKFTNSPNLVAFPFPHAAILEDLDGSLSGKNRSHVLASMETLPASCLVKASFSQLVHGSVCEENVLFHRMSIGLANAPKVSYDLTITDSRNKTTTVSYVHDTLSNPYGWMALLLDQETYSLRFESPWTNSSLQYSATFENFAPGNYLLLVHTDLWPYPDILITCGSQAGRSLPSLPSPGRDQGCDWFFHSQLRQLTYLVSGEGQVQVILQVREGVAPTISASSSAPESVLKWSLPEAWEGMEEGWGGHSGTIPGPGDDVLILPNRTVLVDTDLPSLRGLYVMGTLEFPVDRSNVLSMACMLIAGGELRVGQVPRRRLTAARGTLENPLEKEKKLLILLRASEGVFCDRFIGIRIDPGTIGVFGKVQLHSAYPKKSWTHLGADIASGNERIIVENTVDWRPQDKIVLSSSSYEPHEAEVLTVKEVRGHHISIQERLRHRHIGSVHVMEDGRHIRLASEVGLLTRNIQIQGDTSCGGRLLVGSFRKSSVEEFSGILQLFNVEIQNFGSPLYSSIELIDMSSGSRIISCTLHQSCGGGIRAAASQGIVLNDNVVFSTAGHGIDLEGQGYSLSNNLVVLMTQSAWSPVWVAGIKVNQAKDIHLHGNVVAGSERLGFHIRGYRCSSPEALWSDNVVHSSLHGLHLYKETGLDNCTNISGFLAFKNFDYGAMLHVENGMEIENLTLVDNTIGLLAVVYVSSAPQCYSENLQIVVRNSVIVATSSSFDCIQDRVKPRSANVTSPDRAPSNPRGGRVGILWPVFTSEPNRWPQEPWHKVRNGHLISGIMKLQDVTFSSFVKSCYSDDLDVCILSNAENTGIVPLITAERTRMLNIKDKNKFYFPPLQTRKDLGMLVCSESDCESPRKYLFKDLDGRALGLPPPVSVFPKIEAEWTGSFFNTGTFREEQKCTYRSLIQGYICKQTDQVILILDSADATWTMQKLYPVVSVTSGFVDTFSSVNANTPCSTSGSVSAFYSILPTKEITKVCFVDQTPQVLRFFLLGNKSTSKLLLAVFYHELQSPSVFLGERFITPTQVQSTSSLLNGSIGANYFSIMDNLLYVVLQGEEPIEIRSGVSIHLALTVMFSVLEKGWEMMTLERLTDFLQVSQDQIRFIHEMPGSEATLKAMADHRAKRKRNCPTVTCASHDRVGQRRLLMMEMSSYRVLPPTTMETISKVMVVEIGDLPAVRNTGVIPSLSSNRLQTLAHQVITAQQTGVLENVLNMTIGALLVTQSKGVISYGNTSNFATGNLIYIRPYGLSVLVQPSDGEVGKELTVQPQLVFLDKQVPCAQITSQNSLLSPTFPFISCFQNRRVESLGPPSEPWVISVSLEGTSDSMLRGCTQAETQDGYVRFSNLAVLISGSNWHFIFTVTSPPGVNFTARSRLFAVLPATPSERPTIILAASLCSGVSWLALCCLVCCWFKKSKSRKIKSEEISESQTNDQKTHSHVSPKRQGSQVETEKEGTTMAEDLRMKVMLGKLNQLPHQSLNGVSRRKVSRRAVQEEGGSREEAEAAVPAPSITSVASQGNTCALGSPAQQVDLQETGSWKEAQEQVLRYQLSGQDQLLLPCPDLRRETQRLQGRSRLGKEHVSLGLSQEKPASCGATEAFCLHSVRPEAVQEQL